MVLIRSAMDPAEGAVEGVEEQVAVAEAEGMAEVKSRD